MLASRTTTAPGLIAKLPLPSRPPAFDQDSFQHGKKRRVPIRRRPATAVVGHLRSAD
jgi:hypothetical protein